MINLCWLFHFESNECLNYVPKIVYQTNKNKSSNSLIFFEKSCTFIRYDSKLIFSIWAFSAIQPFIINFWLSRLSKSQIPGYLSLNREPVSTSLIINGYFNEIIDLLFIKIYIHECIPYNHACIFIFHWHSLNTHLNIPIQSSSLIL